MDQFDIKDFLDIGGFGLVGLIILAAIKKGPELIGLWTRGVVAMEKIADDMEEFRVTAVEQKNALKAHSEQSTGYVTTIVGEIDRVHESVLRVESKVDRFKP